MVNLTIPTEDLLMLAWTLKRMAERLKILNAIVATPPQERVAIDTLHPRWTYWRN